jgi:hypothetical protein
MPMCVTAASSTPSGAFALFLARLAGRCDRFVLAGRLNPNPDRSHYEMPAEIEFVGLPYHECLVRPAPVLRSMLASMRRLWRALDGVEAVWLLGPHPLSIAFVVLALARRRAVILGTRRRRRPMSEAVTPGVAPSTFWPAPWVPPTPDSRGGTRRSSSVRHFAANTRAPGRCSG